MTSCENFLVWWAACHSRRRFGRRSNRTRSNGLSVPRGLSQSQTWPRRTFWFTKCFNKEHQWKWLRTCLGFECCHTFVYHFSLLFPSFYCGKKEFFSSARSRTALVLVGLLACWIPAMVRNYLSFTVVNPRSGELVFTFFLRISSAINNTLASEPRINFYRCEN